MGRSKEGAGGVVDPDLLALTPSEAAMQDLKERLAQIGSGAYVLVDEEIDGERQRRGRIELEEFLDGWGEKVGELWGAGVYICDARDPKTFIKKGIRLQFSASYGAGKKGKGAAAPAGAGAGATAAAPESGVSMLLAEIRAASTREHDILMKLLDKPGGTPSTGSTLTAADVAREVERVVAARMPAGSRDVDQVQLFTMAKKLVEEIRGAGTDEDALSLAIKEGGKFIGRLFDAQAAGAGAAPAGSRGGNGNGHGAGASAGGGQGGGVDFKGMAYRQILGQLLDAKKAGMTTEQTASELWENLPRELVGSVYDVLQREDWLAYLAGFVPAVLENQDWFRELREELLKAYAEGPGK